MAKVVFCKHNLGIKEDAVLKMMEVEVTQAVVEVGPCVDQCRACGNGAFAVVDGQLVQAETFATLVAQIQGKLK